MGKLTREEVFAIATAERQKFTVALGNLTLVWADAESALYCILRHYTGVTDEVARAIFSGTRAKQMMDFIGSIAHNTKMEAIRRDDLEIVFAQMTAINTMRDRLTHHLSWSEIRFEVDKPHERTLSNRDRVNRIGKQFEMPVSSTLVEQMCHDLLSICWHLLAHRDSNPFRPWTGMSGKEKPYAWLYKSPPPISQKDTSRADHPMRKRLPKSSVEK